MKALLTFVFVVLGTIKSSAIDFMQSEPLSVDNFKQTAKRSADDFRRIYLLSDQQYKKILELNERFYGSIVKLPVGRDSARYRTDRISVYVKSREAEIVEIFTPRQRELFLQRKADFERRKMRRSKH